MMKKALLIALMVLCLTTTAVAGRSITVLTSLEVVQAMVEVLTEGTSIEAINVIPKGYSMQGQGAYLKKHQKKIFDIATRAEAVVTVSSVWPSDPLYQWARRGNIRIVQIDATKPLDGYGAGVPMIEVKGQHPPQVWRSPANLTRMASITADDLARMAPEDGERIRKNLKMLQTEIFDLRSKYEVAFSSMDFVDFASLTPGYAALTDEFGLDVHLYFLKPERKWTEGDAVSLSARLKQSMVKGVICPWEPDAKALSVIKKSRAEPVVLERFVRSEGEQPMESLLSWYDGNLSRLLKALRN